MNKIKIIILCLLIPFIIITFICLKIRNKEAIELKNRKALEGLMVDLYRARKNSSLGAPADGLWHDRAAFGYHLRVRRQNLTPDILEIQIEAQNNVSQISNLKIRIR